MKEPICCFKRTKQLNLRRISELFEKWKQTDDETEGNSEILKGQPAIQSKQVWISVRFKNNKFSKISRFAIFTMYSKTESSEAGECGFSEKQLS